MIFAYAFILPVACVKLGGTVPERSMKFGIENIAATTLGVDDVANELTVPRQRPPDR